ncbi:MAG: adenylyltransferase/cytidyltransferase family protein [Anaerolineales bacterium]|jgi:cytidyltransferase-like protein
METIVVSGSFDNIKSRHVRFLEEAAKFGPVHVYLWSDEIVESLTGADPKLSFEERKYFLQAVRYVYKVHAIEQIPGLNELPKINGFKPRMWVVTQDIDSPQKRAYCISQNIIYTVIDEDDLQGFPIQPVEDKTSPLHKKVLVTGCFDWLHSGHVRFFEETSQLGDLYVVVGHDENVRLLKGDGHPMILQDERRYMVSSIKFVKQALVSSGSGWMDAEPEIKVIQPDIYAVNEDGDQPEKRAFCEEYGLEYVVLKRTPAAGLPRRESTHLRGF